MALTGLLSGWIGISIGAALGALLRWHLGLWLNPIFPTIPLGTLAANLVGGLLIGLIVEYTAINAAVPPALRLAAITGFLGGLTTFSTFSAESVNLLLARQWAWSAAHIGAHLLGSLALTATGIFIVRLLASRASA
ncbi:MAG: fluoride efflux transporter CrcB [Proteobacteria bacterium]|nr:fluoride efflux transporter CrcB [Pseudomonadota bacterium]MBS0463309.1 fluoride efflux transporter CrcB [Pseudomonadota bacterium]MBS0463918.1 fluoride efflux transporter CrcB [Pseudomonadota bacterium]